MLLESVLAKSLPDLPDSVSSNILLVVLQISLVLNFIANMFDLELIEHNKFFPLMRQFAPRDTFEFIVSMFQPQLEI